MECCDWNEKSDIWSLVCIFIELYTGELFYETREDVEHLAMIEKECGPIPEWMARQTKESDLRKIFLKNNETMKVEGCSMRIDWPNSQRKLSSFENWKKMKLLKNLVQHQYSEAHHRFLDLLEFMMKTDPKLRPDAANCLEHPFFDLNIPETD